MKLIQSEFCVKIDIYLIAMLYIQQYGLIEIKSMDE